MSQFVRATAKRLGALIAAAACLICSTASAHAERIRLFEKPDFGGWNRVLLNPQPNIAVDATPSIRSIRVLSGSWLLCSDSAFGGDCLWISHDIKNLSDYGFTVQIRSAKPERIVVRAYDWGGKTPPRRSIVFFSDKNYAGTWLSFSQSAATIPEASQRPGSVVVQGDSWKLCSQPNFAGRCITVTGDAWDFRSIFIDPVKSAQRLGGNSIESSWHGAMKY